jgi:hypothetical protein
VVANWTWRVTSLTPYVDGNAPGSWLVLPVLFGGACLMMLGALIWRLRTPWRWQAQPGSVAASEARRRVLESR